MIRRSPTILLIAILLLGYIQYASATAQFSSPTAPGRVGFVVSNDRSTMEIIWSCLATITICVWVAQHPDLLQGNPSIPKGLTLTQYKLCRMFGYILGPEYLVQNAFSDWCTARRFTSNMQAKGCRHWKMKHSFLVLMKGLSYTLQNSDEPSTLTLRDVEHLDLQSLDAFLAEYLDEEIEDKDRGDVFAKFVACIQIIYALVRGAVRAGQHLPLCELEVATFGYILCALCTYICWWYKPRDLRRPIIIKLQKRNTRMPGFVDSSEKVPIVASLTTFGTAFGAIHLLAWNFSFPTTTELYLWRITSLMTTFLPLILVSSYGIIWLSPKENPTIMKIVGFTSVGLYGLARTVLLAQSFACFRSLPQAVYAAVWADYAIHL